MKTENDIVIKRRRKRTGAKQAKISREIVANAVEDYLKKGGKITEVKPNDRNIKDILAIRDSAVDIDEILGQT